MKFKTLLKWLIAIATVIHELLENSKKISNENQKQE